jgi:hypothetical protein
MSKIKFDCRRDLMRIRWSNEMKINKERFMCMSVPYNWAWLCDLLVGNPTAFIEDPIFKYQLWDWELFSRFFVFFFQSTNENNWGIIIKYALPSIIQSFDIKYAVEINNQNNTQSS